MQSNDLDAIEESGGSMQLKGVHWLASSDLGGRPEGLQVVGTGSRLFIAHLFSGGFTEVDISDPRAPRVLSFTPAPAGSWSVHLQVQDSLLLVTNGPDMWSRPAGFEPGRDRLGASAGYAAGVRIFDVGVPGHPREVGFLDIGGAGAHRAWFDGGRYALVSAFPPGCADAILMVVDVATPSAPVEVDRWWLPGMRGGNGPAEDGATAAGSQSWPSGHHVSLHHATAAQGWVFGAWRDGGVSVQQLSEHGRLEPAAVVNWAKPDGRGCAAHSAVKLPGSHLMAVVEEGIESDGQAQDREVVLFDIADPMDPRRLRALPPPPVTPCSGARFGPHNLYEYRPGSWADGSLVFVAHQGAGVRIYRIDGAGDATETGFFIPDAPVRLLDPRPGRAAVVQTNDVFVRADGVLAVVDANAGLSLLELTDA